MSSICSSQTLVGHLTNYTTRLVNNLHQQQRNGQWCDLMLHTDTGGLPVHSCIMAAFSPKMRSLIYPNGDCKEARSTLGNDPVSNISLPYQLHVVEIIVLALYTGTVRLPSESLDKVLSAAEWLELEEIVKLLKEFRSCIATLRVELVKTTDVEQRANSASSDVDVNRVDAQAQMATVQAKKNNKGHKCSTRKRKRTSEKIKKQEGIKVKQVETGITVLNPNSFTVSVQGELVSEAVIKQEVVSDHEAGTEHNGPMSVSEEIGSEIKNSNKTEGPLQEKNKMSGPKKQGESKRSSTRKCSTTTPSRRERSQRLSSKRNAEISDLTLLNEKNGSSIQTQLDQDGIARNSILDTKTKEGATKLEVQDLDEDLTNLQAVSFVRCKLCSLKFYDMAEFSRHRDNHPTHTCNKCNITYYRKADLTLHKRKMHMDRRPDLTCHHCEQVFSQQKYVRYHALEVHQDSKPFKCPHKGCDFTATKYSRVEDHLQIHSDVRVHKCDNCDQSFSQHGGLISHKRSCLRMENFLCDLCGQSFNQNTTMRLHRRTIHFGEKPYECKHCNKHFSNHANMRRHQRIHDNSYPYACPVCKQQFRHTNSVRGHMAAKHADISQNMEIIYNKPKTTGKVRLERGGANYKRMNRPNKKMLIKNLKNLATFQKFIDSVEEEDRLSDEKNSSHLEEQPTDLLSSESTGDKPCDAVTVMEGIILTIEEIDAIPEQVLASTPEAELTIQNPVESQSRPFCDMARKSDRQQLADQGTKFILQTPQTNSNSNLVSEMIPQTSPSPTNLGPEIVAQNSSTHSTNPRAEPIVQNASTTSTRITTMAHQHTFPNSVSVQAPIVLSTTRPAHHQRPAPPVTYNVPVVHNPAVFTLTQRAMGPTYSLMATSSGKSFKSSQYN